MQTATITLDAYRNGIRVLTIEHLGIGWARSNFLARHKHLNRIPAAELPGLYAKAQRDALVAVEAEAPCRLAEAS